MNTNIHTVEGYETKPKHFWNLNSSTILLTDFINRFYRKLFLLTLPCVLDKSKAFFYDDKKLFFESFKFLLRTNMHFR